MTEKLNSAITNTLSDEEGLTCLTAQEMISRTRDVISISKAMAENAIAHAEQSKTLVDISRMRIEESKTILHEL